MPTRKRARIEATEDGSKLQLLTKSPERFAYELIRPVVLFGHSSAERARATGKAQRTSDRNAARFDELGMASLFEGERSGSHRNLPPPVRQFIVDLTAEHAAFQPNEIATICYVRLGRKLSALGYVQFRHWRVYGEEGLAGHAAAVWLYNETLSVEFADQPLSQYRVRYERDRRHLCEIARPRLFQTRYRSVQPHLWELGEDEWLIVFRVPGYAPGRRSAQVAAQGVLQRWSSRHLPAA